MHSHLQKRGLRMIGVLVFEDFQLLDASGPISASSRSPSPAGKRSPITVCAAKAGGVRRIRGRAQRAEFQARAARHADPCRRRRHARSRHATRRCIRALRRRAAAIGSPSVCSGAYFLAEAGLLDGRRATTHWSRTRRTSSRRYPKVKLDADRIFIQDGDIWTSAGITAGIDLALALIEDDSRRGVARGPRSSSSSTTAAPAASRSSRRLLELKSPSGRFSRCSPGCGNISTRSSPSSGWPSRPHEPAAFFAQLRGRDRHLAVEGRRAPAHRGRAGARAIRQRTHRAHRRSAGFGDPERMRRAFMRTFGHPPQSLRRAARAG